MSEFLRVGVVGAGHFGRYHALKLAQCPRVVLSGVHDHNPTNANSLAHEARAPALDYPALLGCSDAVIVAVPAGAHHPLAAEALDHGKHVLVEKPIAATLAEADDLIERARRQNRVLQVGHLERFSAAHGALRTHTERPFYIEAARLGSFKTRGTDVSVVLDLMIHDLDLVLMLTDSPIESVDATGAPVLSVLDDIANARIHFASGAVASLTASRVATRSERWMRLYGAGGYVAVDFLHRRLDVIRRDGGQALATLPGFGARRIRWKDHDALAAEQRAFVASMLDGAPVAADGIAGRRALEAALAVQEAIAQTRTRMAESGLLKQFQYGTGGGF